MPSKPLKDDSFIILDTCTCVDGGNELNDRDTSSTLSSVTIARSSAVIDFRSARSLLSPSVPIGSSLLSKEQLSLRPTRSNDIRRPCLMHVSLSRTKDDTNLPPRPGANGLPRSSSLNGTLLLPVAATSAIRKSFVIRTGPVGIAILLVCGFMVNDRFVSFEFCFAPYQIKCRCQCFSAICFQGKQKPQQNWGLRSLCRCQTNSCSTLCFVSCHFLGNCDEIVQVFDVGSVGDSYRTCPKCE